MITRPSGVQGSDTQPQQESSSPAPSATPAAVTSLPGYDHAALERRREELAAQVAELHWDLGGLAYEMAIRDHFRNDVLVRRAALLQECDAELAEVERKLGHERAQAGGLGGVQARRAWARVLPPAQISALLLVAFLGFGVAVGMAAKGSPSRRVRAREVLIAQAPPAATATAAQAASPPAAASEPTPSPSSEPATGNSGTGSGSSSPSTGAGTGRKSSSDASSGTSGGSAGGGSSSGGGGSSASGGGSSANKLPPVKHVFVVMLDDEPYATVFGPASPAHYLTGTLEHAGELLVRYYAVAHEQLANGIALLSGQGPTPQTAQNCPTYAPVAPGTVGAEGQVSGQGCVYPSATQTLAGQLSAKHLTWRAYLEGMDEPAATAGAGGAADGACGHPALGTADPTSAQTPPAGQTYATWRNPFVYFDSVIDSSQCASDDVGLNRLTPDLASATGTPSFAYIVPDRCHDGNATPCTPGAPAGMAAADGFLQTVIPEILHSKAYKDGGLLVITVDEAPSSGEFADSSSCCGQPAFPNLPAPTGAIGKPGGGQVGALLLSPFIKGGNLDQDPYSHFSLLRTVEDLFGLDHLGYADGREVSSFSPSLFTKSG
jgi:phosphatidylinositol-3-phosphatase